MNHRKLLQPSRLSAAAGLAVLGMAWQAQAANLLINPGFEAPAEPPGVNSNCAGWTFVLDCQRAPFGNHTPGGIFSIWAKTFQPVGGGIFQNVSGITAGAMYDFSSWLFFEPGYVAITDPVAIRLELSWLDSGNNPVGTPTQVNIPPSANPPINTWTQYGVNGVVAPTGAATARFFLGWVDGGLSQTQPQSVFFDDAILDGPGQPPLFSTWIINGSGDWNISGNWANGVAPVNIDSEAQFFGAITSNQTVFTNTAVTVGTLRFDNLNTYVLAGAGSLTIDVSSGSGSISVVNGSHKINLPMRLNDNTTANVDAGATLTIADPLDLNGRTLSKTGPGTLNVISTVTGGAAPATIAVTGGTAKIDYGIGTPATGSTPAVANVTVTASVGADAKVVFGANQTLRRLDAVTAATGDQQIDLNGKIVRVYGTPLSIEELNIYNDIRNARQSLSGRDGIFDSTSPVAGWAVGVTDQSTDANGNPSVLVRLTRQGDANVDGFVSLPDFNRLAASFGQAGLWDNGDFNFDGIVTLPDFNLLAANFGLSAAADGPTPEDWAALASAVPEPTSLGAILLGAAGYLTRRRNRPRVR